MKATITDDGAAQEVDVEEVPAQKRGPGRPAMALGPGATRVQLHLDKAAKDEARRLGHGNVSEGVRVALARSAAADAV